MSVSAPSRSVERAAPVPARWRSTCAATVVSAPCLPLVQLTLPPCARAALLPLSAAWARNTGLGICLDPGRNVADKKLKRAWVHSVPFLSLGS